MMKLSRGKRVLAANAVLLGSVALVVVFGTLYSRTPPVVLGICAAIVVGILFFVESAGQALGFIFVTSAAVVGSSVFLEYPFFGSSQHINVRESPEFSFASTFHFRDATLHPDLYGIAVQMGRRSAVGSWQAMPVTDSAWEPTDPVPAYYAFDRELSQREVAATCTKAARYLDDMLSPALDAAKSSAEKHELRTAPGAPVLDCRPDSWSRIDSMRRKIGILALLACAIVSAIALKE